MVAPEWFKADLVPVAGTAVTSRIDQHLPPDTAPLRIEHSTGIRLRFDRETLELSGSDAQQLAIFLPAGKHTTKHA